MHFQIPEFGSHVWISGFDTKPDDVRQALSTMQERFPNVCTQIVDLEKIAGSRYLFLATYSALKSFHSKRSISKALPMEVLLYIAAERQISEAIDRVGVTDDTEKTVALLIGSSATEVEAAQAFLKQIMHHENDDGLVDEWTPERIENVQTIFGITARELKATIRKGEQAKMAIERLAVERSALLAIRK